jgi:hypothetical protein
MMGRMRITMKCHHKGCKKPINESVARLVGVNWYYCMKHAEIYGGMGEDTWGKEK